MVLGAHVKRESRSHDQPCHKGVVVTKGGVSVGLGVVGWQVIRLHENPAQGSLIVVAVGWGVAS